MPLLQTKLYVPRIRANWISRSRLLRRLDHVLRVKLALLSAPAGFGKTALLGEWIAQCEAPVAWLSLDREDDDPARFWSYVVAALRTIPELGERDLGSTMLASLASYTSTALEPLLAGLINELSQATGQDFVLALDDLQVISRPRIHETLSFLLDHMPRHMHVVLSSRIDPPWSLARMRVRREMIELRLEELRFSSGECARFLQDAMGIDLSPDDVDALERRTEGWIAGLQMAALSIQGRRQSSGPQDLSTFIRAFTGSHRFVLDYLVEEVLDQQPVEIQEFLLRTSILERLTGPLCDAVIGLREDATGGRAAQAVDPDALIPHTAGPEAGSGAASGRAILAYLDRRNLFVVPLDEHREWYRYHRLFADLLHKQLLQLYPDLVPILHGRASAWYEERAQAAEPSFETGHLTSAAIRHALASGDDEWAAHLIEQAAALTLGHSECATFLGWTEQLPASVIQRRPSLCALQAWVMLLAGRPLSEVRRHVRAAEDVPPQDTGCAHVLHAFIAACQGQAARAMELSHRALEQLPESDRFLRTVAAWSLSISQLVGGDLVAGSEALAGVAEMGRDAHNHMIAVSALSHLAEIQVACGQLEEAYACYEQALGMAVDERGQPLPVAGTAHIGLGEVLRERNELERAREHLEKGIALCKQWAEISAIDGYISLARLEQAQGQPEAALDAIGKARALAAQFDVTETDDLFVALHQARLHLAQGHLQPARQALSQCEVHLTALPPGLADGELPFQYRYLSDLAGMVRAQLWIAEGQPQRALDPLGPILEEMEARGQRGTMIEVLLLHALAWHSLGERERAQAALARALVIGASAGYVRIYLDHGEPMRRLLERASAEGKRAAYASRLHAALCDARQIQAAVPTAHSEPSAPPLGEPLSERELQVLRYLTTDLSTPEIADVLTVSVHTVRTHVKSIYQKLDVHRRIAAVQRAYALDLL
jgi:LuxR family maltose regulon positive regulatory protein